MIIHDVPCPFCGCLCDDVSLVVEKNRIVGVENCCAIGNAKFLSKTRLKHPIIRRDGGWVEVSYEEAIDETAKILAESIRPLLYGWSGTYGEAQVVGVHLAEELGALIDSTTSVCHNPSILAIQEVGHPGTTLGQVKNRADLVIYWGCNPIEAHPRHLSRYTTYADGYFFENTVSDRKVVVVDIRRSEAAKIADEFIQVTPGGDYHVLSALRAMVRGRGDVVPGSVAGVKKEQLERLVALCMEAKYIGVFFGLGVSMTRGKYKNVRNAIELVSEISRKTKCTISAMRGHYNVYGFNEVLTWMAGYPFAVDFSRGIAFYNPGETTVIDLLERKEPDASLIIASDPGAHFPYSCNEHIASIPSIQIDPCVNATTALCRVQIPVAITGIEVAGTAYRMDGVPIRMKKVLETEYPTDQEILERIYAKVRELNGNG
ncbi:MAG: formylmethanofuran dehydrogenase subunit B [Methanocalculus sp. MSAO_Arc1]|uniref:formylmethanofuran dehydrogenase subunit B n=1 Tax=Methanocalculus TaxID=71151 RepID=UPI000FF77A0E|nr:MULTISPECIES: formylmethanofuran dehydrogenase subunit B [unclassified Methanocalculus]MCP1662751.1 formylmethanofuran dehydrogenase subunit B [Methanocalculus sp. AMF5]RQD78888.1 MAG: formylmethanofuran dehydrogenase subunit B [Methanocalculus sp. MSAO_Arc1]